MVCMELVYYIGTGKEFRFRAESMWVAIMRVSDRDVGPTDEGPLIVDAATVVDGQEGARDEGEEPYLVGSSYLPLTCFVKFLP